MSLMKWIFHRNESTRERPYHHNCPKGGQTEECDPFKDDPRPLPGFRARRVSDFSLRKARAYGLPLYPPGCRMLSRITKVSSNQEQSLFFSQLPLELRRACLAQALCVAEGTIHIYPTSGKYSYTRCQNPKGMDHQKCWTVLQDACEYLPQIGGTLCCGELSDAQIDTSSFEKTINLGVLISCRRMYIEAVDLLYAGNTFSFGNGRRITVFLSTVLSHRFNSIRRLSFNWTFYLWDTRNSPAHFNSQRGGPEEPFAWITLCSRVAEMPYLRQLRCTLKVVEHLPLSHRNFKKRFNIEREREFLEPLKQISKPNQFEVVLKWEQLPDSVTKNNDLPFTILWGDEAVVV